MAGRERIESSVGEPASVTLRGGGGTGFSWVPHRPLPDAVTFVREVAPPDPSGGIGGMGRETLSFTFGEPGTYHIDVGFTAPGGGEVVEERGYEFVVA